MQLTAILLFLGLSAIIPVTGHGQDFFVQGTNEAASWGAYNRQEMGAGSFNRNKAALARVAQVVILASGDRPFNTHGLGRYRLASGIPAGPVVFGLQAGLLQAPGYAESLVAVSYARALGKLVSIGMQAGWMRASTRGYKTANGLVADLGFLFHAGSRVTAGWNISLPYSPARDQPGGGGPVYSTGVGYDGGRGWSAALETRHSNATGTVVAAGFIYRPVPSVQVRMGFGTGGPPVWIGVGYRLAQVDLMVSFAVHDRLGISPALTVERYFKPAT